MKIAVTGASGHVGANLVPALLEAGYDVRGLYRTPAHRRALDGLDVELRCGDLLDTGFAEEALRGVKAVIHLAGLISIDGDPGGRVMRTNVEGTRNVVEACLANGVRRLVHFSSIDAVAYTADAPVVDEGTPLVDDRAFAYRVSKRRGEEEAEKGAAAGLAVIVLRPSAILGPKDYFVSASGQMLRSLFANTLPALVDAGFNWVDVRDVVAAALAALRSEHPGESYLITGHYATTPELSRLCRRVSGRPTPRLTLPLWMAYLGLPFLRLQSRLLRTPPLYTHETLRLLRTCNRNCSSTKAERELGYTARPLEETIRDTYTWYREVAE